MGSFGDELGTSSRPVWSVRSSSRRSACCLMAVGLYSTPTTHQHGGRAVPSRVAITNALVLSALVYYFLPNVGIGRRTLFIAACFAVVMSRCALLVGRFHHRRGLLKQTGARVRRRSASGQPDCACAAVRIPVVSVWSRSSPPRATTWSSRPTGWSVVRRISSAGRWRTRSTRSSSPWTIGAATSRWRNCWNAGSPASMFSNWPASSSARPARCVSTYSNPSWIVLGEGFRESSLLQLIERTFDLLTSLVLLVLALPVDAPDCRRDTSGGRLARAGALPPGPRGALQPAVRDAQVPQHAGKCRGGRSRLGLPRDPRITQGRRLHPQDPHRRAAAADQRAARRHEPRRAAPGAAASSSSSCRRAFRITAAATP